MREYNAYTVDENGDVSGHFDLRCPNHEAAKARAKDWQTATAAWIERCEPSGQG